MIDLTKLADAVAKVASLANAHAVLNDIHADAKGALARAMADYDALKAEVTGAQASIDHLVETLLAATTSPAEAVGIVAVAAALSAPAVAPSAPVIPAAPPVAPVIPVATPMPPVAPTPAPAAAPSALETHSTASALPPVSFRQG
jgi:hypothetical protein